MGAKWADTSTYHNNIMGGYVHTSYDDLIFILKFQSWSCDIIHDRKIRYDSKNNRHKP